MNYWKLNAGILGILVILSGVFISCSISRRAQLEAEGNKIIIKIESYRENHHRLPDSLSDVGIEKTLDGPVFYEKKDDSYYILWFGRELGESVTYDSATKIWK